MQNEFFRNYKLEHIRCKVSPFANIVEGKIAKYPYPLLRTIVSPRRLCKFNANWVVDLLYELVGKNIRRYS